MRFTHPLPNAAPPNVRLASASMGGPMLPPLQMGQGRPKGLLDMIGGPQGLAGMAGLLGGLSPPSSPFAGMPPTPYFFNPSPQDFGGFPPHIPGYER